MRDGRLILGWIQPDDERPAALTRRWRCRKRFWGVTMLADLKPYPEMRDSGVEWLGEIPANWEIRRVRTVVRVLNGATPSTGTPAYWDGDILWITPEDLGRLKTRYINDSARRITRMGYASCGTSLAPAHSLAISTRAPIGHIGILEQAACVNQGCRLLIPDDEVHAEYLYYEFLAVRWELEALGQGSTFVELSAGKLSGFALALPPLTEQAAIVRFLDHVDRRIRRYIRAKQKLIALLEEQKQTLISEAVTGRMDIRTDQPFRAYKASGVDWLNDVPQHWERRRLKTLLRSVDQRSITGEEPLLSLRRDHGVVVYAEHFSRPPQARSLVGFKLVATGQLVVNRMQANNGLIFCSSYDGLVSPDYSVFETKTALQMEFLSDLLRTPEYLAHFRRSATGLGTGTAGFLRLYDDRFLDTVVFLPPEDEQTMVLRKLSNRVATINTLIDTERRALQRIDEYRSCLVAEVITGKVDVREAVVSIAEDDPLKVEDNQEVALRRDAKSGLHGSGRISQEM